MLRSCVYDVRCTGMDVDRDIERETEVSGWSVGAPVR